METCSDQIILGNSETSVGEASTLPVAAFDRTGQERLAFSARDVIHSIFENQVCRRGMAIAATDCSKTLTYEQLNSSANRLARYLVKLGVTAETPVALYLDRSVEMVVAILAILKAGGAYVPIDLAYPRERVSFMLEDSNAPVLVTESKFLKDLPPFSGSVIAVDQDSANITTQSADNLEQKVMPDQAAYIIYTSGSTGKPKGVAVTHANVVRLFGATDRWFQFNEQDVWSLFHSFAFDFSVWELWGALLYGGKLVVVPYLVSRSPEAFYSLLSEQKVTVLNQTPSAFRQLIWADQSSSTRAQLHLRYVVFGGEALELQSLKPWFQRYGDKHPQLVNMYGITETTVHVTYRPISIKDLEANLGSVIGVPIPDLTLLLLDENQQPVPVGTPGELYVGGAGVARGYLNRPELNAQKFITNPISKDSSDRLYRSGDLAQYTVDGELEYLGRIDLQVKIRGFRIELGEIESAMNRHSGIRECTVIARDEASGERRLVAYAVCVANPPSTTELRAFLTETLPQYMVPSQFVFMDALPLTINGKVDRKALPAPDNLRPEMQKEFVAPTTPEETILAEIWSDALKISQVGIHDNFFELGGDSIRSIQVLSQAQAKGIKFSLQKLFQHPTIFEIVRDLDEGDSDSTSSKPFSLLQEADRLRLPAGLDDAYPAAKLQVGMIFHSDYDPASAIFHDVFSFRLNLPYDLPTFQSAIQRLAERHPIYRTSFDLTGFTEPLQLVHKDVKVPFTVEDLRTLSPEQQKESLVQWVEIEKRKPFDWSTAPMMRLHLQRYTDEAFQFIVSFHHVIMDGWSLAAMLTELFQDYDALLNKTGKTIAPPRVTYRDFVQLESQTIKSAEARDFWTKKLENPTIHQVPRWPQELCKKGREQVRGPEIYFDAAVFGALKRLASSAGVPIRTVLMAAHVRVMAMLTGQTDIITGLVANGRPQTVDGERLLGLFLNTLPLRLQLEGGSWKELVRQTFKAEQELLPYRRAPLSEIQQWSSGRALFETTFDFVQFHVYKDLPGYKDHSFLEDYYFEANNFTFFTTFMLDASASQLQMHFDYDPNVLCEPQIKAICDYYGEVLAAMAANPDARYENCSLLPQDESHRLLEEWNNTTRSFSDRLLAHQLFEQQAKRTPQAIAASYEGKTLNYEQLNRQANRIAAELHRIGVPSGGLVGIYQDRSLTMLVSLLAVLKAGCAYVPLDPAFPAERLAFMMSDAKLTVALTQEKFFPNVATSGVQPVDVDALIATTQNASLIPDFQTSVGPEHIAYVIYTSGSTGKPKGVQIPHRAVVNFLESMKTEPGMTGDDTLLAVTTLSFDIAGLELLLPLTVGGKVVIASSETTLDPSGLAAALETNGVTVMQATPTTWHMLVEAGWKGRSQLKALCGGEALPPQLAAKLLERCGSLWNMYGPTETTIWSCVHKVKQGTGPVPIGRPIANTQIYLLDQNLLPVPQGSDGDIYIGGAGLAHGYLNRDELTAEKFVANPFDRSNTDRLYKTGDIGRYLPDGEILCLGRSDHQVKIRGFRIELGEIESALSRHSAVAAAVVTAQSDGFAQSLVAYWAANDSNASVTDLREHLQHLLPFYMVPSFFVQLAEFPLTPNGKIDRNRLPKPAHERPELKQEFVEPRSPFEEEIAATWKQVMKVEKIGVYDNFFELGGHSLLAMQVVARLREKLEIELSIASLFNHATVESLALHLLEEVLKQQNQEGI